MNVPHVKFEINLQSNLPVEELFAALSDPIEFSKFGEEVRNLEFINGTAENLDSGTKFRHEEIHNKKVIYIITEYTEYVKNRRYTALIETNYTWMTCVTEFSSKDRYTLMQQQIDCTPKSWGILFLQVLSVGAMRTRFIREYLTIHEFYQNAEFHKPTIRITLFGISAELVRVAILTLIVLLLYFMSRFI
jgi:hypothetical protein